MLCFIFCWTSKYLFIHTPIRHRVIIAFILICVGCYLTNMNQKFTLSLDLSWSPNCWNILGRYTVHSGFIRAVFVDNDCLLLLERGSMGREFVSRKTKTMTQKSLKIFFLHVTMCETHTHGRMEKNSSNSRAVKRLGEKGCCADCTSISCRVQMAVGVLLFGALTREQTFLIHKWSKRETWTLWPVAVGGLLC